MRKKHLFWMLLITMVLLLSISVANAQHVQDVDPQIDDSGLLIDENEDTVNTALVCIDCDLEKYETTRIFYSNCSEYDYQEGQSTQTGITGIWNAFDRDIAFNFSGTPLAATADASWYDTRTTGFTGKSHVGYCNNTYDQYLFAICNCVLKNYFLPGYDYVFEVEVLGDGVFWTDRNLSLFYDATEQDAVYDVTDTAVDLPLLGGTPYNYQYHNDDNVIRFVVGSSQEFFCNGTWVSRINTDGWVIGGVDSVNYDYYLGYAAVKDYITRSYKPEPNFDQSTCYPTQKPFVLDEDNGVISCATYDPATTTRWNGVNAKILRTYPVTLFPTGFPVLSQTPYLYIDLPTMIYKPGDGAGYASLCDTVEVMITLATPFVGVCSTCCNLPMCSCTHEVGTFGCDASACEDPGTPTQKTYYKCVPYLTYLIDDWWDALAVANMGASSIAPVVTFFANGQQAEYQMDAIPAHAVSAIPLEGDVSDEIQATYPDFPLTGHAIYAQVSVTGTSQFDVFALIYNPAFGTTSMLARCNACGICSDCN